MFGKVTKFHGSGLIEAEIIASGLPATMPTTSDGIDNLGSGYTLAPGSTMIVTGTDKQYILGDDGTWEEYSAGGGGDLSAYQEKILSSPVTIGAETATTVEGAIGATADVVPSTATEQNKLATAADVTGEDIATTVTGTAITVTDSADARVQNIQIFGRTESGSSVGDNGLAVTLKGKNLFNINGEINVNTVDNTTPPQNWTIDTSNKKNTVSGNVLTAYRNIEATWPDGQVISVKTGHTYTLSFRMLENPNPAVVMVDYWNNSTSRLVRQVNWWDRKFDRQSITFVAQTNSILLGFGCGQANMSASFTDIMLEENDELTDYEPYRLTTLSVTSGLPLRSNGDVKDDVNFAAGMVTKRIDTDGTVLATPVETLLSATEINAFRALRTYAGKINITATDSPTMNFSYLKNTDNGNAVAAVQDDAQKQITGKQDALTFDSTPTENSTNPVTSGGVYDALQGAGGGSKITLLLGNVTISYDTTRTWTNYIDLSLYDAVIIEASSSSTVPADTNTIPTIRRSTNFATQALNVAYIDTTDYSVKSIGLYSQKSGNTVRFSMNSLHSSAKISVWGIKY